MRIGVVCPYSFDVPGGVQAHVRDLAEHLGGRGHVVSVLAPTGQTARSAAAQGLVPAGRSLPVPYNGSVSRIGFGPVAAGRVLRWLDEGRFDVVHLHEPLAPSTSLLALWATGVPVVATFHTALARSRALRAAGPLLQPGLEKITARIAVSEEARRTVVEHVGGDAVVIPNGVFVDRFAAAVPHPPWQGTPARPVLAFVGRLDEPRKGLAVLLAALPALLAQVPGLRLLVAGRGGPHAAGHLLDGRTAAHVEFLGGVDDRAKAALLRSADLFIAP
ncbi:glycosyltransferase family 4 protein, partial [Kineococcus glutinatus]|uniref:glycosyltransferase family 4 protein n=1 Tax=Kineococcus glutinatus TaxID=1070872 RepID=UPI0031ED166F